MPTLYVTHCSRKNLCAALAQTEAVAPTQDPLTSRDRRIIAEIIQV
ncbi:hypothetical protein [aff. Roholtiella sp. LEGE 12411]|nr:hypothetical protein [aff. Roholtiella sp. LEGE 12411]